MLIDGITEIDGALIFDGETIVLFCAACNIGLIVPILTVDGVESNGCECDYNQRYESKNFKCVFIKPN